MGPDSGIFLRLKASKMLEDFCRTLARLNYIIIIKIAGWLTSERN
jgi:hypothetical protein